MVTKTNRTYASVFVIAPFAALIAAIYWCWNREVKSTDICLLIFFYAITGLSITAGFHRLFSHHGYKTVAAIRYALAICASMAAQGFFFEWIAEHRCHHKCSDSEGDPHSPHTGNRGVLLGMLHAHVGWMFGKRIADPTPLVPDLASDTVLVFIDRVWWLWVALGLFLPSGIGWLVGGTGGAVRGFVWGGLVRMFFVNHVTWSVNSICHLWGSRSFKTGDFSGNVRLFGLLAVGEGWHNNHHAFPSSARHGLDPGQFDATWLFIRGLKSVGLVWDIRVPDQHSLDRLRV
jgi:stearoyl-CoA desaturase (delta-9 desaturase)